jgi:DNA-binding response OmpR family regulator
MRQRALIVDDQPDIRKLIRLTLQFDEYFELFEADNGEDAWRMAQDLRPAVVLLDVMMPGALNGHQVCRSIKSHPVLSDATKVVLITARAQASDREQGRDAGCDGYITKPFTPSHLLNTLDDVLQRA